MSFTVQEASIADYIKVFGDGVVGEKDKYADTRTGSAFDNIAGPCAILWNRETVRDTDLFKNIYFSSAEDTELTNIGQAKYGIPRIMDTRGTGYCIVSRVSGVAGTFPTGTQIAVIDINGLVESRIYYIAQDVSVSSTDTVVKLPIKAVEFGSATTINTTSSQLTIRFEDPIWDNSWTIESLKCSGGTEFEPADQYRARVHSIVSAHRKGYVPIVVQTCIDAGAVNVITFPSNYAGNDSDFGINTIYVGDNGFDGTIDLRNACIQALESARVLGANLQVLGMVRTVLDFDIKVYLVDDPNKFDLGLLSNILTSKLSAEFSSPTSGFSYGLDQLRGVLMEASNAVQFAEFSSPNSDSPFMQNTGVLSFPTSLSKLVVGNVKFTYLSPI